jgi:hypothetical protein
VRRCDDVRRCLRLQPVEARAQLLKLIVHDASG